jgi:cellobiose phosphorylase
LKLDPCIPPDWKDFSIVRKFRGGEYDIKFLNPDGKSRGIKSISIDGKDFHGDVLPVPEKGRKYIVKVML